MVDPAEDTARAEAECVIDGLAYRVTDFHAEQGLGRPGEARVVLAHGTDGPPGRWLGRAACLRWRAAPGDEAAGAFAGEVIAAEHADHNARATLTLAPRLARLAGAGSTRVFRRLTLAGLVARLLGGHGLAKGDWRLALGGADPARAWVLQAGESDLAFLERVLAAAGAFYFIEVGAAGRERVVIADHNAAGGALAGAIRYRGEAGLGGAPGEAHALAVHRRAPPAPAARHVATHPPAERPVVRPRERRGTVRHAAPAHAHAAAARAARLADEAAAARAAGVTVTGNLPALRPGASVALAAEAHPGAASGDYLITRVRTHLPRRGAALTTEAALIALATPWRALPPSLPELPAVLAARVEAEQPDTALVDARGDYRVRLHADALEHPPTEASPGLPALTPYASPTAGSPAGWHTPLRGASEVLVTCLDGDPERPCLVGFAPAAGQRGPVSGEAPADNVLTTPAGNRLALHDTADAEAVVLETFAGQTLLRLDAASEAAFVRLACAHGALLARAGRDLHARADGDLGERAGGARTERVGEAHRSTTRSGHLRRQAGGDARLGAGEALVTDSDGDTQLVTGARLVLDAERAASVAVDGPGGMRLRVDDGALHAQAAGDITLTGEGGGDLVIEHNGAGIAVLADGTVRLFGEAVSLHAGDGSVAFNGPVDYEVPAPNAPTRAAAAEPAALEALEALRDPRAARLVDHGWPSATVALTDAAGTPRAHLPAWYTTRGYDPGAGPVQLTLWRERGGARTALARAAHTPEQPDGAETVALPAPALADEGVALEPVAAGDLEAFALEARGAGEQRERDTARLVRALAVSLRERSAGAPPIAAATLWLEDRHGAIHTARVRDGAARFDAVPVGRFRLWGEDGEGASLALVGANGTPLPPGARAWLREAEPGSIAARLALTALPAPVVVNLRETDDGGGERAWRRHHLTAAELDYFRRQGGNATVFIHGYNVGLGHFPPALAAGDVDDEAPGDRAARIRTGGGPHDGTPGEHGGKLGLVAVDGEARGYRDAECLRAAFPDAAGAPDTEPDGAGALGWLLAMEGNLNRAAAGGAMDYARYERLIGVAWSGDVGVTHFWDSELNAAAAGRGLVALLCQLADAGLRVNVITHSLGARVALTALNAAAELREAPVVEQLFLWQPAVSEHAFAESPAAATDPLGHEHFPAAHRAARRLVVLHTRQDGVLGARGDGQPHDPDSRLEDTTEEIAGIYAKKYWIHDDLAGRYLDGLGGAGTGFAAPGLLPGRDDPNDRRRRRLAYLPTLRRELAREAELARPTPAQRAGEQPLAPLARLLPWAREAEFSDAELDAIIQRLTDLLARRENLPDSVAPAMGWSGPANEPGTLEREMRTDGKLEVINQHDLLTTHSGMHYPDERLFEEIYRNEVMRRIKERTGFGTYL